MTARAVSPLARAIIGRRLGLDLSGEVLARHGRWAADTGDSLERLAAAPEDSPEWRHLVSRLTVSETYFFRDRACFAALEEHVLPGLIATRRARGALWLRLWSAGCASGEEPYTLAMLLDRLLPDRERWAVTILATDVSPDALAAARAGRYREWSFRDMPAGVRERYFRPSGPSSFALDPGIRQMVTFVRLNLATDAYPSPASNTTDMDVVVCRNLLMYFTPEARVATARRLRACLAAGGWLALGAPEASAELTAPLVPVRFPGVILYRDDAGAGLPAARPEPTAARARDSAGAARPPRSVLPPRPVPSPNALSAARPGADDGHLDRARRLADEGRLEEARALCQRVLDANVCALDAQLLMATIAESRGDAPAALAALRRAIYLDPDCALAHFLLGSALLRSGASTRARRSLETSMRLIEGLPGDAELAGGAGVSAGRLRETAREYLALTAPPHAG